MKNHKDFTMYSLWMTTDCYTQINFYIAANPPPPLITMKLPSNEIVANGNMQKNKIK